MAEGICVAGLGAALARSRPTSSLSIASKVMPR